MRVVVERVEEVLVGKSRVAHPLLQVSRFLVVERELDEGARRNDVSGALVDVETVRYWRLEGVRSPVLRTPTVLHPVDVATVEMTQTICACATQS